MGRARERLIERETHTHTQTERELFQQLETSFPLLFSQAI